MENAVRLPSLGRRLWECTDWQPDHLNCPPPPPTCPRVSSLYHHCIIIVSSLNHHCIIIVSIRMLQHPLRQMRLPRLAGGLYSMIPSLSTTVHGRPLLVCYSVIDGILQLCSFQLSDRGLRCGKKIGKPLLRQRPLGYVSVPSCMILHTNRRHFGSFRASEVASRCQDALISEAKVAAADAEKEDEQEEDEEEEEEQEEEEEEEEEQESARLCVSGKMCASEKKRLQGRRRGCQADTCRSLERDGSRLR